MCPTQWDWPLGPLVSQGSIRLPIFRWNKSFAHLPNAHLSIITLRKKSWQVMCNIRKCHDKTVLTSVITDHTLGPVLACYCDFCSTTTLYAESCRKETPFLLLCLFPFHDMSNHRVDMASHWGLRQTLDLCLSARNPGSSPKIHKKGVFPQKLLSSLEAEQTLFQPRYSLLWYI